MTIISITAALDTLAEVQDDIRDCEAQRTAAIQIALGPVQAELAAIEARFAPELAHLRDTERAVTEVIKDETLQHGASVKGSVLHAIYTKGRTSWDGKGLDGYAVAHPELLTFRKEGEPSISIRAAK